MCPRGLHTMLGLVPTVESLLNFVRRQDDSALNSRSCPPRHALNWVSYNACATVERTAAKPVMSDLKPTQTGDQPPLQGREFDDSAKEASEHERAAPSGDHRLPPDPLHVSADPVPVHESGASGKLSRVAVGGAAPAAAGKAPGNPGTMTPLASLQHSSALSFRRRPEVWGWLQPAPGTKLPFVLLQGRGVAIGRGREAFHERLPQLVAALSHAASRMHSASATPSFGAAFSGSLATLSSIGMGSSALDFPSPFAAYALGGHASGGGGGGGGGRDSPTDGGSFVEVADGRVSRLHAWVKWDGKLQAAVLEVRALRCCCCSIRLLAVCSLLLPLHYCS